jgi:hypothetical protein
MTGALPGRDTAEVDALVTDRYLETLLGAHARGADGGPSAVVPSEAISSTAHRLARDLPRLHPSFLFEEALASRLAAAAARMARSTSTAVDGDDIVTFPGNAPADDDETARARHLPGRPWLLGGAFTSAALSLAGAAFFAWRLNRASGDPMVRAARAVARSRAV